VTDTVENDQMPIIEADFTKIVAGSEPLPDADYLVQIEKIEDKPTDDGKPGILISMEVKEGEYEGRYVFENLVFKQNDGKPNKISLGRLKEYGEAVLGKETANSPKGINTDDLVKGMCKVHVVIEGYDYEKNGVRKTGTGNKIKRVQAVA
jgi:Protein of unknown function (DUF669)